MYNWFYAVVVSAKDELIFLDFENEKRELRDVRAIKTFLRLLTAEVKLFEELAKKYICRREFRLVKL